MAREANPEKQTVKKRPRRRTKSYPGSITKRGGVWRVRLCVGGKRHRYTVQGTRVEAENFATAEHAELTRALGRVRVGLPGQVTFSELLRLFREQEAPSMSDGGRESYEDSFKVFEVYFVGRLGDPIIQKLRAGHIKEFIAWRRVNRIQTPKHEPPTPEAVPGSVTNYTVGRDRRVLNRLFNYAVDLEYIDANPCARVKAPKADERTPVILDNDQYDRLLDACGEQDMLRLYILVLAETGCRSLSEAVKLTWDDVDLAGGFVQMKSAAGRRTKSGKSRWTPMTPKLAEAMREHFARYRFVAYDGQRTPWLFHHTQTARRARAGERRRSFRNAFESAVQRAELPPGFRPHDLRHRRVTKWLAEGRNPVHVKEAVGHADLATTMRYTHLAREHLRALVAEPAAPPAVEVRSGA